MGYRGLDRLAWNEIGAFAECVFDVSHNRYFAAVHPTYQQIYAFDSGGTRIWTGTGTLPYAGVSRVIVVASPHLPGIPLPYALARPGWNGDRYTGVDALALQIALQVPTLLRDYVGPFIPFRYRVYLTGTPNLELPCSQISIRLTASGQTVSVYCPAASLVLVDEIDARSAGTLVIRRGVVFEDGDEQLDEMTRAALSSIRYDAGSSHFTISLDGTADTATSSPKTRTLYGINYIGLVSGLRRVRCAVDTWLAVGDTADLGGGDTLTVGQITHTITVNNAIMEIAEAV